MKIINKTKCKLGFHLWKLVPTLESCSLSSNELVHEVICIRCGKHNKDDIIIQMLLKLINTRHIAKYKL